MARKHRSHSKKHSRRTRKHRGGGQGAGYEPGGQLNPGAANGLMVNRSYDSCMSASRPGQLGFAPSGGLPGMKGGSYTTSLTGPIAGLAEYNKVACIPNHTNPLNQRGGVGLASAKDMGVYEAHTARYTTAPSQWAGSTGAPVLLNQGLSGTAWSKACTQTAGRRRALKGKKSMKHSRKYSRKHGGGGENYSEANPKVKAILDKFRQDPKFQQEHLTPEERDLYKKHMEQKFGHMWMYQ